MSDVILGTWVSSLIKRSRTRGTPAASDRWAPGKKLRLLIAGYNGAKNTGEEVRVEEMARQFRRILGAENIELSVLTLNPSFSQGYYEGAAQVHLPHIFPLFLYREVPKFDGVIASCGSMFSSKFSNVHCMMMIEALGIASGEGKLAVAYGGEAGTMDSTLAQMCRRFCSQTAVILRNEESRTVLRGLGIPSQLGTDTAWTVEACSREYAEKVLRDAGWDGAQRVLAICPNNPFWWPVKPSITKAVARTVTGAYSESHYKSIYFHNSGEKAREGFKRYVEALGNATQAFRKRRSVFPILVAMERLDVLACERISERLGSAPIFASEDYNAFQLVSILRSCQLIAASRYHAVVTSMPGLVPSAGVTIDERIRNLMRERGQPELVLEADDPELEGKFLEVLERLITERDAIRDGIGRTVVNNLKMMAKMGEYFEEHLRRVYLEFPVRDGKRSWEDYLPPLSAELRALVEKHSN